MDIESIVDFLKEIEKFKTCERECHTTKNGRAESDAEHSWHLAIFLILLENEFEHIDFSKVIKMALIHDLPEIYAGDTNPYRDDTTNKEQNEKNAAKKLFSMLPEQLSTQLESLFIDYLKQESPESQLVKSADKLMPLVQNLCTNEQHSSYRNLEVEYKEAAAYMDRYFPDGVLKNYYRRLLSAARKNGVFFEAKSNKKIN